MELLTPSMQKSLNSMEFRRPTVAGLPLRATRKASLFPSVFLTRIWLAPGSVSTHCEELLSSRMASERNPCPEPLI